MSRTYRIVARGIAALAIAVFIGLAQAQAPKPIPIEEQVRLFNSLTPEQQRALIREVQQKVPPEQAEKIIGLLQGVYVGGEYGSKPRPSGTPVN